MPKNPRMKEYQEYRNPVQIHDLEKEEKKRIKEREKRIKQNQKEKKQENYDMDTETVIKMTNQNNQRKKQIEQRKLSYKQQKEMKKKKRRAKIIKALILLAFIIGGTIFAFVSPIFNVTQIEVTNNKIISQETIISLSGLTEGQNLFQFNKRKTIKAIKENPYINEVEITRKIPNKIMLEVEERKRNFSLEFLNGYAYINNQGYILEIAEDKLDLPVLQGATTAEDKIVAGERLEKEDLEKLSMVIQIMDACKNAELDTKVTSIDMNNKFEYSISIESEKKKIYLGDGSNLSNKILWVQAILEDTRGKEGEIFVNGDLNNKFKPRFREKV